MNYTYEVIVDGTYFETKDRAKAIQYGTDNNAKEISVYKTEDELVGKFFRDGLGWEYIPYIERQKAIKVDISHYTFDYQTEEGQRTFISKDLNEATDFADEHGIKEIEVTGLEVKEQKPTWLGDSIRWIYKGKYIKKGERWYHESR
jgi:hypothetical protein